MRGSVASAALAQAAALEGDADRLAALRQRAGRPVPVTLFGAIPSMLADFAAAGVDRCLFTLHSGPGDLDQLDRWAA